MNENLRASAMVLQHAAKAYIALSTSWYIADRTGQIELRDQSYYLMKDTESKLVIPAIEKFLQLSPK